MMNCRMWTATHYLLSTHIVLKGTGGSVIGNWVCRKGSLWIHPGLNKRQKINSSNRVFYVFLEPPLIYLVLCHNL